MNIVDYFHAVVNQLITILLLLLTGFYLRKSGKIDAKITDGFFLLVTSVGLPCSVIVNLQRMPFSHDSFSQLLTVFAGYMICSILGAIIAFFIATPFKIKFPEKGLWIAGASAANLSFVGQPVIAAIFGDDALFLFAASITAGNIIIFSVIMHLMSITGKVNLSNVTIRNIAAPFRNTIIYAAVIGLALYFFSVKLPAPVLNTLNTLATITSPVAMLGIGSTLASASIMAVAKDRRIYVISLMKLIILPLAGFFLLRPFIKDPVLLAIIIIGYSMPITNAFPGIALKMKNDAKLASELVFMSTLLCLVSIPVIVAIVL